MNVKIPGLKYNKTINEQLDVFERYLNKYGTLLLELQGLNEKHKAFINWLEDRIKYEMKQNAKVKQNTVEISESNDMKAYLEVLDKFRSVMNEL